MKQLILPCINKKQIDIISILNKDGSIHTQQDQRNISNFVIALETNYERLSQVFNSIHFTIETLPKINDIEEYIWIIDSKFTMSQEEMDSFQILNQPIESVIKPQLLTNRSIDFIIISNDCYSIKRIKKTLQLFI